MNIINIHEDHHSQMLLHLFLPLGPVFPHALLKSIEYVLANTHQVVQPFAEWLNSRKGPSGLNAEVDLAFRWVCDAVATKLHVRVFHDHVSEGVAKRVVLIMQHKSDTVSICPICLDHLQRGLPLAALRHARRTTTPSTPRGKLQLPACPAASRRKCLAVGLAEGRSSGGRWASLPRLLPAAAAGMPEGGLRISGNTSSNLLHSLSAEAVNVLFKKKN